MTRKFLELCRSRMTADGVFVMNINSAIDGPLAGIFHSMYRTVDSVFPNTYIFAVQRRQLDADCSTNIILLATLDKKRITQAQWTARAKACRSNSYVTNVRLQQMVEDLFVDLPDTARAPAFSDDYAPIETMAF